MQLQMGASAIRALSTRTEPEKRNFIVQVALSKNGNVVVDAVFLALGDALRNPNNVPHFLR
jgi:hypothetical protein